MRPARLMATRPDRVPAASRSASAGDAVGKVMCQHANMHGGLWLIVKPNGQANMAKGMMHMK